MERFFSMVVRIAFSIIAAAGGVTAIDLIRDLQRNTKTAMKSGISYEKFNRSLFEPPKTKNVGH